MYNIRINNVTNLFGWTIIQITPIQFQLNFHIHRCKSNISMWNKIFSFIDCRFWQGIWWDHFPHLKGYVTSMSLTETRHVTKHTCVTLTESGQITTPCVQTKVTIWDMPYSHRCAKMSAAQYFACLVWWRSDMMLPIFTRTRSRISVV